MTEENFTNTENIEREATRVLALNDRGNHTIPAAGMYPHTWLWDEVFTDIGLRHLDAQRAALGITSLFRGQWRSGMVPNMIFTKGRLFGHPGFKPDYLMWNSRGLSDDAPRSTATTGITQPPVIAEGIQRVGKNLGSEDRKAFYAATIGKTIAYHQWIYRERNTGDGLMTAVHPWETGMENTPAWMEHMKTIDWGRSTTVLNTIARIAARLRRDTKTVASDERATLEQAVLYADAFLHLRRTHYDHHKLAEQYPLHIQDVHMNSVLIRNNDILQELATDSGDRIPDDLLENISLTRQNINELWNEKDGLFYARDAVTGNSIPIATIACLMPLYSGATSPEQTRRLVEHMANPVSFGLPYPIPTVPTNSPFYHEKRYWSGPSWVNMNWLIADGLRRSGRAEEASKLSSDTLAMVAVGGMKEYFAPHSGQGLGAPDFSWTAGLALDIAQRKESVR